MNGLRTGVVYRTPCLATPAKELSFMRNRIGITIVIAIASLAMMIASHNTVFAQASSSTAELRGQVIDVTGAVIPNAKLTLTDVVKGTLRTTSSDGEGNYAFLGLLP